MVKVSGDFDTKKFMSLFRQYFISKDELMRTLGYAVEIATAQNNQIVVEFINTILIPTYEIYFDSAKEEKT